MGGVYFEAKKMRLPFTKTWSNKGAALAPLKAVWGVFRCLLCIHMEMPIIYLGLGLRGRIPQWTD